MNGVRDGFRIYRYILKSQPFRGLWRTGRDKNGHLGATSIEDLSQQKKVLGEIERGPENYPLFWLQWARFCHYFAPPWIPFDSRRGSISQ